MEDIEYTLNGLNKNRSENQSFVDEIEGLEESKDKQDTIKADEGNLRKKRKRDTPSKIRPSKKKSKKNGSCRPLKITHSLSTKDIRKTEEKKGEIIIIIKKDNKNEESTKGDGQKNESIDEEIKQETEEESKILLYKVHSWETFKQFDTLIAPNKKELENIRIQLRLLSNYERLTKEEEKYYYYLYLQKEKIKIFLKNLILIIKLDQKISRKIRSILQDIEQEIISMKPAF